MTGPGPVSKRDLFSSGRLCPQGGIGVGSGPSACKRFRQSAAFSTAHPASGASFSCIVVAQSQGHEGLTAKEDDMDQVAGLEMGADDYVKKPIEPRVLLARIRAKSGSKE